MLIERKLVYTGVSVRQADTALRNNIEYRSTEYVHIASFIIENNLIKQTNHKNKIHTC